MRFWPSFLTGVLLVATVLACNKGSRPPKKPLFDKSPETQAKRRSGIDDLIRQGVIAKVEMPSTVPRVWVRPLFYRLEFDQKKIIASAVYAYYLDDDSGLVLLLDSQNGKEVGQYSVTFGLEMN